MSKIIQQLRKVQLRERGEEELLRESARAARRKNSIGMTVTPEDRKEMLSLKAAHVQGKGSDDSNHFLEEFESFEKELLELREEETKVLLRIREILEGSI